MYSRVTYDCEEACAKRSEKIIEVKLRCREKDISNENMEGGSEMLGHVERKILVMRTLKVEVRC